MRAAEFLAYSGEHYEENKKKWTTRLKKQGYQFNEDIYNDTIIKVYDHIDEYTGDIESYWYKAFLQNIKRDTKYSIHKKDDTIDVLKYLDKFPNEDPPILLDDVKEGLKPLTDIEKNLILLYYLTDMSYIELEDLTDIKNVRHKIKSIIKKIRGLLKIGPF